MTDPDLRALVPADNLQGEDEEETTLLREMLAEAREYLLGQPWCHSIVADYFGAGVGGVCAAWLFRIDAEEGVDEWLWVVNGDIPSAYLVCDEVTKPKDAFVVYADIMQGWVDAVREGKPLGEEFPVPAAATEEMADMLGERIELLRTQIVPAL